MSNPLEVVVIDDEPQSRRLLRKLLSHNLNFTVVEECANGKQAVDAIKRLRPDIIFLDIQMPGMSGFDVIDAISTDWVPYIVFVTAYDRYALRAFEAHALDYLLKPVEKKRFNECLDFAKHVIGHGGFDVHKAKALSLSQSHQEDKVNRDYHDAEQTAFTQELIIRESTRILALNVAEVLWFEAANQYVNAHTTNKCYLLSESLNGLQEKLDPARFFRVHRSAIVNITFVQEIRAGTHSSFTIILTSGKGLALSRRRRDILKELLQRQP